MELESQMDFIVQTPKVRPKAAPDVLTEILFEVSPALTYQWVEDYGKSGPADRLNSIGHLTNYWNGVLAKAGEHQAAKNLQPGMTQQTWIRSFREHVIPILRTHRKLLAA